MMVAIRMQKEIVVVFMFGLSKCVSLRYYYDGLLLSLCSGKVILMLCEACAKHYSHACHRFTCLPNKT